MYFIVGNGQQAKEEMRNEVRLFRIVVFLIHFVQIDVYDDITIVDVKDTYMNIVYKVMNILSAYVVCSLLLEETQL